MPELEVESLTNPEARIFQASSSSSSNPFLLFLTGLSLRRKPPQWSLLVQSHRPASDSPGQRRQVQVHKADSDSESGHPDRDDEARLDGLCAEGIGQDCRFPPPVSFFRRI